MRYVLALVLLGACTVEHQVLDNSAGVITSCDQLKDPTTNVDSACAFSGTCELPSALDPLCCHDEYSCTGGKLELSQSCRDECRCSDDSKCLHGAQVCGDNGYCVPCEPTAGCPECPPDWMPLLRNGCPSCECGPPPMCDAPGQTCDPNGATICYPGASCAPKCTPLDPGCCANVCSPPGCPTPAPLGCSMVCPVGFVCDSQCAAIECNCSEGQWQCSPACVGPVPLTCRID